MDRNPVAKLLPPIQVLADGNLRSSVTQIPGKQARPANAKEVAQGMSAEETFRQPGKVARKANSSPIGARIQRKMRTNVPVMSRL
jgi:hypothetical protein